MLMTTDEPMNFCLVLRLPHHISCIGSKQLRHTHILSLSLSIARVRLLAIP